MCTLVVLKNNILTHIPKEKLPNDIVWYTPKDHKIVFISTVYLFTKVLFSVIET